MGLIIIQDSLLVIFQSSWLPFGQVGFLTLRVHAKKNFGKKKLNSCPLSLNTTMQMSS